MTFASRRSPLDHVTSWEAPGTLEPGAHTVVKYTYHADAAPFMHDPDVARVFPMVARVLAGDARLA